MSSSSPSSGDPGRQGFLLKLAVAVLLAVAFIVLVVPGPIPKPVRIGIALTDLIAAAVIWIMGKQRLGS